MKILSGSAHPKLAKEIAKELKTKLGEIEISKFSNGEKRIWIKEEIANKAVFVIQPTITDEDIIELCLIVDAAKRRGVKKIIAVTPWFGYSAQDDVFREGEPLSAKVVIGILEASGIDEFILVNPHSKKILSFFSVPAMHLSALEIFVSLFKKRNLSDFVVVSLDLGAMERSLRFSKKLNLPLVLLQKTPRNRQTGEIDFLGIKGKVAGKNVLIFDDFVSTGGTLVKAASFLKEKKAGEIIACVTHYLSVKGLPERLQESTIDKIFVTDTLPISKERRFSKLKVVSIASLIAKEIRNVKNRL